MTDASTCYQLSQGYLLIDTKKCSGCMSCMMACTLAHEGRVDLTHARIQIKKHVFGTYPDDDIEQYVCKQCADAPCVAACPTEALVVDPETGVRAIDEQKCIGCKLCMKACKYEPSRIVYDFDRRIALKCDLCTNTPYWDEKGGVRGKQACIDVCSLQAIAFSRDLPETEEAFARACITLGRSSPSTMPACSLPATRSKRRACAPSARWPACMTKPSRQTLPQERSRGHDYQGICGKNRAC